MDNEIFNQKIEIDFIRYFIPKLKYVDENTIIKLIQPRFNELRNQGIMLSRKNFRIAYPDLNINIYYIFNDELKGMEELEILNHWHRQGRLENRIFKIDKFFEIYSNYDNEFFYNTNKKKIENFVNENYINFFDLQNTKLNQELTNMKVFHHYNQNNINYIKSIYDFLLVNTDINLEIIALFNKNLFRNHICKKKMTEIEIKEIIYFYLNELENENRSIIFTEEEFYKKYENFDLELFRKFNKKYKNLDDIICITDYHNNQKNLIGSLNDFLEKYDEFDLDEFKENMIDKNLNVIDNLIKYHENEDYRTILSNNDKINVEKENNSYDFDWEFYLELYPDLKKNGIVTKKQALKHWNLCGKKEGRKGNLNILKDEFYKKKELVNQENKEQLTFKISNKKENRFNILIRHSYRPKAFKKCIDSVLNLFYSNIRIIICYDDKRSIIDFKELEIYDNIDIFYIEIDSKNEYVYELYSNELLKKVEDGWIIFLDDDDYFLNPHSLKLINYEIEDDNDLIIWKYLRGDMEIYPKNIDNINCGEITSCGYTFHSKFKNLSKWDAKYSGDYSFFSALLKKKNFYRKFIDKLFIGIQDYKVIGSSGKNEFNIYIQDYLNLDNIKKIDIDKNNLQSEYKFEFINLDLTKIIMQILEKNKDNKKIILTIANSLYPPNGGGENWLLDLAKFNSVEYFNIGVCFRDILNKKNFTEINLIDLEYINILQIPYILDDLINLIRFINPEVINHQGHLRYEICEISCLLNIKMITGFCFWNNIIEPSKDYYNINMTNQTYKKCSKFETLDKYVNCYAASNFVNEILEKVTNKKFEVIETISEKSHYIYEKVENKNNKYVSLLNCNYLKGGQELLYLVNNLDINIPLLGILTEKDDKFDNLLIKAFEERNKKNNINKLLLNKLDDIKEIYKDTEIILIPSLVDETFCKVAYESMCNNLKIISYRNGNLKYLLKDYNNNIYIDNPLKNNDNLVVNNNTLKIWLNTITTFYYKEKNENNIEKKDNLIKYKFSNFIKKSKFKYKRETIGLFCPFVDQGLGIHCREYYEYLKQNGYKVSVFSHKPFFATQVDKNEWNYENIYYSSNKRDNIKLDEIINFVFKFKVKLVIIPEICYFYIYPILRFFMMLNVKVITPINIETLRYNEFSNFKYIDTIIANNTSSYNILSNIFPKNKVFQLNFNNYYFKKFLPRPITSEKKIIISTFGGYNSFLRKNIDKTYQVFKKLEREYNFDYQLNIYIQGEDASKRINLNSTGKINFVYKNNTYKQILQLIRESNLIIHLGDHEGLGLGFFEALNNNIPILTLNTYPNCEYVNDQENGFLVDCTFGKLEDNNMGITNKAIINTNDYFQKIRKILSNNYRDKLVEIINKKKHIENDYSDNFKKILLKYNLLNADT